MRNEGSYLGVTSECRSGAPGRQRPVDPLAQLKRISRELAKLERFLTRVADDVGQLVETLRLGGEHDLSRLALLGQQAREAEDAEHALKRQAEIGVKDVALVRDSDGSGRVAIEQSEALRLTPRLADMIEALCDNGAPSTDDKVAWKTKQQLAERITASTGRPFAAKNVPATISRLREALRAGKENWFLVQTNRDLGYRFAKLSEGDRGPV